MNKAYWHNRYTEGKTAWDIGYVSTPLKNYIDQLKNKSLKILVPGVGNGYEAQYLWEKGFKNIFIVDIAEIPLDNFKKKNPEFPEDQIMNIDFFELNDTFDLILEQTFFCALNPDKRPNYVEKSLELLKPNGKLVGLLFDFPLTNEGPPFGGNIAEYKKLFQNDFRIKTLERSINSIKERQGKELFFIFEKKT
jgi:thiopurine S-methyltransferase